MLFLIEIVVGLAILAMLVTTYEQESYGIFSIILLIVGFFVLWNYGIYDTVNFIMTNWAMCLIYALIYVICGIFWSFYKLQVLVKDRATKAREIYKKQSNPGFTELEYVNNYIPSLKSLGDRISAWVVLWPVSVTSFVAKDMIAELVTLMMNQFSEVYKTVYKNAIDKVMGSK